MEVRQVRFQEIKLVKYDMPEVNIRYTGRSDSMRASDSDPVWQILLEVRNGDITVSTYALMGEFKCKWDQRTSYFATPTEDASSPLGDVSTTGSFRTIGQTNFGVVTVVSLNSSSWTALPATSGRNAIAVQNESSTKVKLNYSNSVSGFVGMAVYPDGGERRYDIDSSILLYGKCESGTASVNVEEIG